MTYLQIVPLIVLFSLSLAGCRPAASGDNQAIVYPGRQWTSASPQSQGLDPEKLQAAVEHVRSVTGEVGVSRMVIVRNGYVVWQGEQAEKVDIVYSCTKSFTSTCLGLLWDDGIVSPDDLAADYLPMMKEHYPTVKLWHLSALVSGYNPGQTSLDPTEPAFAPGTALEYNRQGDVLSAALTRAGGRSLESLFRQRITNKIGIADDSFGWGTTGMDGDTPINGGAGNPPTAVRINALAMARFGWLLCNMGQWNGRQLISRRYIQHACRPLVPVDMPPHDPKAWYVELIGNYGMGWWTNGPLPNGQPRWPHAPAAMFAAQGNRNNVCFIIPEWQMVVVRLGGDKNIPMHQYDGMFRLLAEAMEEPPAAASASTN